MKYLITGGAGFIGSNFASRLIEQGNEVVILDDLSRKGAQLNLQLLDRDYPQLTFIQADVSKDTALLNRIVKSVDVVFHLAAQVGVTTSVVDPRRDFEINALGTFNILEAIRVSKNRPALIYASTNKVYGSLDSLPIYEASFSYRFKRLSGVSESQPLDFHSPYGCSKGIGDQYVTDYARIYDLKTVVFRQSCIYGPGQFGSEDQGWVAWFAIAAMLGLPIVFYGNGKQTRDLLYIDDLFDAWMQAVKNIERVSGLAFNIGGGLQNSVSLRQFVDQIRTEFPEPLSIHFDRWRPGDQRIYISDNSLLEKELGWSPRVDITEGTQRLFTWIRERREFFVDLYSEKISMIPKRLSA